jgi:hypothetical protein
MRQGMPHLRTSDGLAIACDDGELLAFLAGAETARDRRP